MVITTGAAEVVVALLHVRLHRVAAPKGHPVFLQGLQLVHPRLGPAVRSIPLHWQQEGFCPRRQRTFAADNTFRACMRKTTRYAMRDKGKYSSVFRTRSVFQLTC